MPFKLYTGNATRTSVTAAGIKGKLKVVPKPPRGRRRVAHFKVKEPKSMIT